MNTKFLFFSIQKNKLHQCFVLKILPKFYQLPILGTLGMSGYANPKSCNLIGQEDLGP